MRWKRLLGTAAVIGAVLAVAGVAWADGTERGNINACASRFTGTVRIIDPQHPRPCFEQFERAVSWAEQGPPGPPGPQGPAGPEGKPGSAAPSIWAVLGPKSDGTFEIQNGQHTTGARYDPEFIITVSFDRDVSRCAYVVTPRVKYENLTVTAFPDPAAADRIVVQLKKALLPEFQVVPFQVLVVC